MGTSGAYGGSKRRPWKKARGLVLDLSGSGGGTATSGGTLDPTSDSATDDESDEQEVSDVAAAIAEALSSEDPSTTGRPLEDDVFELGRLLPSRGVAPRSSGSTSSSSVNGGGVGGGMARGATSSAGRRGTGSSRTVTGSAARGGAVLAGGYALRARDAAALDDLGMDLAELEQLGPRMQCAHILDAVLGDGGHPDEYALREAAAEQLKTIVLADSPPTPADALRGFIGALVFKLGLVEVRSELNAGNVDVAGAARAESRLRRWIDRRVRQVQVPNVGRLPVRALIGASARLSQEALRVLRAGLGGSST